ncbi:hypothetical protein M405DRAFT_562389 [Rhizopogon salebrosus TDB-379]|nr:hypothetical protein M405DRAFT_562389 [Rhizopogon salebrosus TDB-379]
MASWNHLMYSLTSLSLLHMLGTSQTWQALWFAFLVIFVSNLFSSSSLPFQLFLVTFMHALHRYERQNSRSRPSVFYITLIESKYTP